MSAGCTRDRPEPRAAPDPGVNEQMSTHGRNGLLLG